MWAGLAVNHSPDWQLIWLTMISSKWKFLKATPLMSGGRIWSGSWGNPLKLITMPSSYSLIHKYEWHHYCMHGNICPIIFFCCFTPGNYFAPAVWNAPDFFDNFAHEKHIGTLIIWVKDAKLKYGQKCPCISLYLCVANCFGGFLIRWECLFHICQSSRIQWKNEWETVLKKPFVYYWW